MTSRKRLEEIGIDYKIIAKFFGYKNPVTFANSSRRTQIEDGILKSIEYIQERGNV